MNMFIILIPFLVSMAVFSHLSVLQFSLPSDGNTGRVEDPQELPLTVAMTSRELAVTRGDLILATVPNVESGYDFSRLVAALIALTDGGARLDNITIAIDDEILFSEIVACMDHCREAGFIDVGLANGTNLARHGTEGGDDADH
ncbi:MAG: hypothetical protein GY835_01755 [bacterium]|nr:hypothetical protein [bacterium]